MSSLLSRDSISLSGLSLTMSGSIKHKDQKHHSTIQRPSSFFAGNDHSTTSPIEEKSISPTSTTRSAPVVPAEPKGKMEEMHKENDNSRDTSTDRENGKELGGSDGSWSVVSGEGRSRAGSLSDEKKGTKAAEFALGPVIS